MAVDTHAVRMTAGPQITTEHATVIAALARVLAETNLPEKRGRNEQQRFDYISLDDILREIRPACGKHQVVIVPTVRERIVEERKTSKGSAMFVVHLHVTFEVWGPAGDRITGTAWGEGTDMGDKATGKAMTNAYKNFIKELFQIAEADPDGETPPEFEPVEQPKSPKVITIERIADKLGTLHDGDVDAIKADLSKRLGDAYTGTLNDLDTDALAALEATVDYDLDPHDPEDAS